LSKALTPDTPQKILLNDVDSIGYSTLLFIYQLNHELIIERVKMAKTLKELAAEINIDEKYFDRDFLMLDNRYAVMQDAKGLHLTDVFSWASFNPIKIGRKSNATVKGLQFQLGQYKVYIKQLQGAK
jgi:hypothetical protein